MTEKHQKSTKEEISKYFTLWSDLRCDLEVVISVSIQKMTHFKKCITFFESKMPQSSTKKRFSQDYEELMNFRGVVNDTFTKTVKYFLGGKLSELVEITEAILESYLTKFENLKYLADLDAKMIVEKFHEEIKELNFTDII